VKNKLIAAAGLALALALGASAPATAAPKAATYDPCAAFNVTLKYAGTDADGRNRWRLTAEPTDGGPSAGTYELDFGSQDGTVLATTYLYMVDKKPYTVTSPLAPAPDQEFLQVLPASTAPGCDTLSGPRVYETAGR